MKRKATKRKYCLHKADVPWLCQILFQRLVTFCFKTGKELNHKGVTYTQALLDNYSADSSGSLTDPAPWSLKTEFIMS